MTIRLSEKAMYTTVKLTVEKSESNEIATGFIFKYFRNENDSLPVIVTNTHEEWYGNSDLIPGNRHIKKAKFVSPHKEQIGLDLRSFFLYAKDLLAAALGIEILCITAAELGENTSLYVFGFNTWGIAIAYVMGYSLDDSGSPLEKLFRRGGAMYSGFSLTLVPISTSSFSLQLFFGVH